MSCNTFGTLFKLTTFGESHGEVIGGVVDGMPAGFNIDVSLIQNELNRRRPGQSQLTTSRREADQVQLLSGVFEGKSTGSPIAFTVQNLHARSADYEALKDIYRPSHADYTYHQKYGIRDFRGGGRASARITLARCVGGALAKMVLRQVGIDVKAYVSQVGAVALPHDYRHYDLSKIETNAVRCPDEDVARQMSELILQAKAAGDTVGGIVTGVVTGCPLGLGEPEFGKLHAQLAAAMLSINAAKGFEYGSGFAGAAQFGSQQNDAFICQNGEIKTRTNNSGGIQGGISNGEDIYFNVAFKPVATLLQPQQTINTQGETASFTAQGRHDPCIVPRAVPVVEAMAAMVLLDNYLLHRAVR